MNVSAHEQPEDLGHQIDAMLADAEQRAESAPRAGAADDDFQSEMISAVGEAEALAASAARRAAQAAHTDPPDTAQPNPATIDELDQQLATAAPHEDDLPEPAVQQEPAVVPHQSVDQLREEVAQALTAPPAEEDPEPAAEAPPAAAEPEPTNPEPEPAPAPISQSTAPEPAIVEDKPKRHSTLLALLRAIPLALAWPLSFLPPAARDQIGWLALVTLFNASAVWVYLLLRH